MKQIALIVVLILATGCSPYAQVQVDLLEHARKGIASTRQSLEQKSQLVATYHEVRRRLLDEAFDADVRERQALDADWVIEHRRAYSAAVDALHSARLQSEAATLADERNLAAIELALARVALLQSIQSRWFDLSKDL